MSCCPIEVGEVKESEAVPYHTSNDGEEPCKTVRPLALESDKAQQDIKEQCGPELPADSVFGVSDKVADFECLLDLFEESFDAPSAAIQVADTGSSPFQVIGQEDHGSPFSVNLDPCLDSAQSLGILRSGLRSDQGDLVVTDDVVLRLAQSLATDVVAQIVLGSGDPEDVTTRETEEVGEVDVGFVEDGDLARLQPSAQGQCPRVVMMRGFFDDGKSREECLQVQSQMHLGRSLASTVLGPVHAVGNQSNRRGIDRVDRSLETTGQATVATRRSELRIERLEMTQDTPKQFLHHVAVAVLVGMRKRITAWCDRASNGSQLRSVVAQTIADVVQPDRMSELREQQADHLTPRGKGPSLLVHTVLLRKFCRQMRGDEFTKLMQCAAVVLGRRYLFQASDSLVGIRRRPPFLYELNSRSQLHPVG